MLAEVEVGANSSAGRPRHAEDLVPAINSLSNDLGIALADLFAIAVGIGPGMFTGLRVGVTTAKTLATALNIPMIAISSLDLIAHPLRHAPAKLIVPMIDARRTEVYYAIYRPARDGVERVSDYALDSPTVVAAALSGVSEPVLLCGDGSDVYRSAFEDGRAFQFAGADNNNPSVRSLVELASNRLLLGDVENAASVVPMYIRRSDAEISLEARTR